MFGGESGDCGPRFLFWKCKNPSTTEGPEEHRGSSLEIPGLSLCPLCLRPLILCSVILAPDRARYGLVAWEMSRLNL